MNQQEPRRVLVGGRVTDRRSFEKDLAICVRRRSEKFFRDVIPWARQQVMLPLRQHVVNTVEADHRFDLGGYRDMGIGPIFAGKCWLLARERNQSRKVGRRRCRRPFRYARDRSRAGLHWHGYIAPPPWC